MKLSRILPLIIITGLAAQTPAPTQQLPNLTPTLAKFIAEKEQRKMELDAMVTFMQATVKARIAETMRLKQEINDLKNNSKAVLVTKYNQLNGILTDLKPLADTLKTEYPDFNTLVDETQKFLDAEKTPTAK